MTAKKYDQGKPELDLVPSELRYGAARGLMHGAKKYSRYNWREGDGLEWSRLWNSLNRHLQAWWDGEEIDPDSGLNHLDHAAATLAMLMQSRADGVGKDNRPTQATPAERRKFYKLRPLEEVRARGWYGDLHPDSDHPHSKVPRYVDCPADADMFLPDMFRDYYEPTDSPKTA